MRILFIYLFLLTDSNFQNTITKIKIKVNITRKMTLSNIINFVN